MAVTTPDAVPGELITAAWGDAVRADLTTLDTGKVGTGGDWTMGGGLTVNGVNGVTVSGSAGIKATGGIIRSGGDPSTSATGVELRPAGGMQARTATSAVGGGLDLVRASAAAANAEKFISFTHSANGIIGSINIATQTTVAYVTTSDPRTKTAPSPRGINDAAERAAQLGRLAWQGQHIDPATGQADGETWDFLSSHDIGDVAPYAVHGERDAVDETGAPIWQQVDFPALVPLLFAALANALDRIAALEGAA